MSARLTKFGIQAVRPACERFGRASFRNSARIRVVGVNPGPVLTDYMLGLMRKRTGNPDADWRKHDRTFPFGRPAMSEEAADLVLFLASRRANSINGTVMTIDGGLRRRTSTV